MKTFSYVSAAVLAAAISTAAAAETRVTYKSAKTTSSYYQMAVQIAESMKKGSNGNIIVTVEESQGSVQNVKEAAKRFSPRRLAHRRRHLDAHLIIIC